MMDKQLKKFIDKETKVVLTPCLIGVEPCKGREFVTINFADLKTDTPMYQFWHKPNAPKKPPPEVNGEQEEKSKNPKHTGGKLSYSKIYTSEIKKYPKDKLSYEYAGMCLHLAASIEWNSGYLICGRGKRKRCMDRKDIAKELDISESTVRRLVAKLEELQLLKHDDKGYKFIGKLFAKGREVPCELSLKKE